MKLNRFCKNKKGFISIESIFAMTTIIMLLLIVIGFFTWMYPRIMIQVETHTLVQQAKVQGGLTDERSQPINSDIALFKEKLVDIGYKEDEIEVYAVTVPGNKNAIGVTPINESGTNYIKRNSKEKIQITVKVPNNKSILAPLSFFGNNGSSVSDKFTIVESVMSERW